MGSRTSKSSASYMDLPPDMYSVIASHLDYASATKYRSINKEHATEITAKSLKQRYTRDLQLLTFLITVNGACCLPDTSIIFGKLLKYKQGRWHQVTLNNYSPFSRLQLDYTFIDGKTAYRMMDHGWILVKHHGRDEFQFRVTDTDSGALLKSATKPLDWLIRSCHLDPSILLGRYSQDDKKLARDILDYIYPT